MANNIPITTGSGAASVAGETVSGITYQQIEVYGGGGASILTINPDGSIRASIWGTPTVNASIVGGSVSISGNTNVSGSIISFQGGAWSASIIGNASVSGTVGASIIGSVNINPASVSGTVGASVIGTVPVTQSGSWNVAGSVVGFQGGSWTTSVVGGPVSISSIQTAPNIASIIGAVTLYAQPATFVSGVTSIITTTNVTSVLATAGAGVRNYITQILVTNQQASVTGAGTTVNILDDGSSNVLYTGYAAAGGGGFAPSFPVPLRQQTSTFSISAKALSASSVLVSISGFTGT